MHHKWIKTYGGYLILGLLLIAAYNLFDQIYVVVDLFKKIYAILIQFVIAACIAYLLYIPQKALRGFLEKSKITWIVKKAKALSIFITYFIFLSLIASSIYYVIPIIVENIVELSKSIPIYTIQLQNFLDEMAEAFNYPDLMKHIETTIINMLSNINFNPTTIISSSFSIVGVLFDWLMAIVICPYLLFERESLLALFDRVLSLRIAQKDIDFIHNYASKINRIFSDFIFGKSLDSFIIGLIAYAGFSLIGLDFVLILAIIIGLTNMIPYFGPFIGGIPVTIFVLITQGIMPGVWTGIFIFLLQQLDGIIIGPYILGESVGVKALWIIFAITFFGGTMGFMGMVIGVPLIAVIRMVFNDYLDYRQKQKNGETIKHP